MTSLIPKKYDIKLPSPTIDDACIRKNIIFMTIALNGEKDLLRSLLTESTTSVLKQLGVDNRFGIGEEIIGEHSKNFPDSYKMDSSMQSWMISAIWNPTIPKIRNWPASKKLAIAKILVSNGATAIPLLFDKEISLLNLKQVIDGGVDVNSNYQGCSSLHVAVISPSEQQGKIDYLITSGANVNSVSTIKGYEVGTPAHILLANENYKIFEHYVTQAANTLDPEMRDGEGKTLLLLAAKTRSVPAVVKLLELFRDKININAQDIHGRTPLYFASLYGCRDMVEQLVTAGADINSVDNLGSTPLHCACVSPAARRGVLRSIEIDDGRDASAPLNALTDQKGCPILVDGNEVLFTKTNLGKFSSGQYKAVNQGIAGLIDLGNALTGISLAAACEAGVPETIKYLLENGADPLLTNVQGKRPSEMLTTNNEKARSLLLNAEGIQIPGEASSAPLRQGPRR
jgi:ankyrin repeat protein